MGSNKKKQHHIQKNLFIWQMHYFIYKKIFGMANNYSHLQKHYKINYFGLQNYYFGIRAKFIPENKYYSLFIDHRSIDFVCVVRLIID